MSTIGGGGVSQDIRNNLVAPLTLPATTANPLMTESGTTLDNGAGGIDIVASGYINGLQNVNNIDGNALAIWGPIVARQGIQLANGAGNATLRTGAGAPTIAGALGDIFFRTDAPTTADERIYICTTAGSAGTAVWTGIV